VVTLLALATFSIQCGKKGPPKPPPSKIPSPITDLKVQQRGMEMVLRMGYPTTTIGGLPLETVEAVEVWEMKRIIPAFTDSPELSLEQTGDESASDYVDEGSDETDTTLVEDVAEIEEPEDPDEGLLFRMATDEADEDEVPKEDQIEVDPREFELVSRLSWSIREPDLQSAILGDSLVARIPIEEITEVEEIHVFGARVYASDKLVSASSNLAKILPRQPPPPPEELSVEPSQVGIKISWQSPGTGDESAEEEDAFEPEGFNVYRRNANVREYDEPLFTAPATVENYTDVSASFDRRYIYTVTTILSRDPLIESAVGAEYEVNYQDRFEPEPPSEITALPETNQVRLLWELSSSDDVAGYRIYRQDPGGEYLLITAEPVIGSEYLDQALPGGQIYSYFIVAVDGAGNQSEASDATEVRVP
jgi:hypothetical protein